MDMSRVVTPGQNNLKDLGITVSADVRLACFAKYVVAAMFVLVLTGGHTTTSVAGIAFADWPLSDGSVNHTRWWTDVMQRLEHVHWFAAKTVGLIVAVVCARVWRCPWAVPVASVSSAVLAGAGLLASGVWLSLRATIRAECEEGGQ